MDSVNHTYGFVGLGLIGGSLAINLRKLEPHCRIVACSRTRKTCEEALKKGVIDSVCENAEDPQFSECSVIFLCAPAEQNIAALPLIRKVLSGDALLTDVGSVKGPIHRAVKEFGLESQFIGGHPMTGSEKSGLDNATDHMFENAYYILTPTESVPPYMLEGYLELTRALKAIPLVLDPDEHDFITAAVSHLPHVIAASLVNTVHDLDGEAQHMKMIAAGGFRDITRIASSSPVMWESICLENNSNIAKVMDTFLDQMIEARDKMCAEDGPYINHMFEKSRDYRDSFSFVSHGPVKKIHRIYCDVIDENGAIATIATILAVNGISIKNISIVHNREFEQGALSIEFYRENTRKKAVELLRHHRYTVWELD